MNDPNLRNNITALGLQALIPEGVHAGQTVADVWINSKRGRYWLAEDARLQAIFPDTIAGKPTTEWLAQAAAEKPMNYARWFSPESSLVKQFLQHIVYGEEQQAKNFLEAYTGIRNKLLTSTVKVTDYSMRQFKGLTAFQLALCAWDNEMCGMLKSYMHDEEATRQYQAIFPAGHTAYAKRQQPFDFTAIIKAITSSNDADLQQALQRQPNDSELWKALTQFRKDFTMHSQQERIFNPKHLSKAFEQYDVQCGGWDLKKRDVCWRQVIGYIQRFLPANIAQDFAQGLYFRMEIGEASRRSLHFRVGGGAIYPLSFTSLSGLGFECAEMAWGQRGDRRGWMAMVCTVATFFEKLMSSKNSNLAELMPQPSSCVIS